METIKICFYKRHLELYGCNIIGLNNFNESMLPRWYKDIEWLKPMLPVDWELRIKGLLKYRESYLKKKYTRKS